MGLVPEGGTATYVAPDVFDLDSFDEGLAIEPSAYQRDGVPPAVEPTFAQSTFGNGNAYGWHLLPNDVLFRSYVAGVHQPRMAAEFVNDSNQGTLLDVDIGSRVAILRKGTVGPNAEGVELQVYAAALARLSMDRQSDVEATDFVFGVPFVWRRGPTAVRLGYDHVSSHIGDEYLLRYPNFERINYVRDAVALAVMHNITDSFDVYGEANYGFHVSGGAERWHFQLGAEYQPYIPPGFRGAPVVAVNTLLREEFDYEGSLGVVAGWQWRGITSSDVLRVGLTTYIGRSRQFSFFDRYEKLFGVGIWYDFF
jgi:hypothetical protein